MWVIHLFASHWFIHCETPSRAGVFGLIESFGWYLLSFSIERQCFLGSSMWVFYTLFCLNVRGAGVFVYVYIYIWVYVYLLWHICGGQKWLSQKLFILFQKIGFSVSLEDVSSARVQPASSRDPPVSALIPQQWCHRHLLPCLLWVLGPELQRSCLRAGHVFYLRNHLPSLHFSCWKCYCVMPSVCGGAASVCQQFPWLPIVSCYYHKADCCRESWFNIQRENNLIKFIIQFMVISMPLRLPFRKLIGVNSG